MTESARRKPIDDSGLEGHNCCRLSLRRSDLFSRQSDSVQFRVGVATHLDGGGQSLNVESAFTPLSA